MLGHKTVVFYLTGLCNLQIISQEVSILIIGEIETI